MRKYLLVFLVSLVLISSVNAADYDANVSTDIQNNGFAKVIVSLNESPNVEINTLQQQVLDSLILNSGSNNYDFDLEHQYNTFALFQVN